jgi:cholestenol delta-isomerase
LQVGIRSHKLKYKLKCYRRIRRVKCDETKPHCNKCTSTGRKCDGYSGLPLPRTRIAENLFKGPTKQIRAQVFDDDRQHLSFNYYVTCTSDASQVYYGTDFWRTFVLQLSQNEPAIRCAVCSLSFLHKWFRETRNGKYDSASLGQLRTFSLQKYSKAIAHTQRLLTQSSAGTEESIAKGLVVCILFVCYENMVGNYAAAHMHLRNGLRIFAKRDALDIRSELPKEVSRTLDRLELQAMAFGYSNAPYSYESYPEIFQMPELPMGEPLVEILCHLVTMFKYIFRLGSAFNPRPIPQNLLENASTVFLSWKKRFSNCSRNLLRCNCQKYVHMYNMIRGFMLFEILATILEILILTGCYGNELLHDAHLAGYTKILQLSQKIVRLASTDEFFTFEIGMAFPLFFAAIKCRDPVIRRDAITLLKRLNSREGSFQSVIASEAAEFVMGIEEEGLEKCTRAEQIVGNARVHSTSFKVHPDSTRIEVSVVLRRKPMDSERSGEWYTREGRLSSSGGECINGNGAFKIWQISLMSFGSTSC